MKYNGYFRNELTPQEIDIVRQTQATLAIEQLSLKPDGVGEIVRLVSGELTREDFQQKVKDFCRKNETRNPHPVRD
ncbi:MAG: antitoxin VbhA family protein [Lachnospiraceae bacterium]|nr:antitoxin VbhA family protein [Lachnospiraceae bacterium]